MRIELQTERLELEHSSEDVVSVEAGKREWSYKKFEEEGLGPRWGPVKTVIFENEPSLFCCRYCK